MTQHKIVKTMEKFTGDSRRGYYFIRLGRYYGVFEKTQAGFEPVNMKAALRDCGFGSTADLTSYQAIVEFWPREAATP
jgi:hypothetical protein